MKYRTLGRTGIEVSPYCLGAMMFGAMGNPDHDDSIRIIHKALDAGINFLDTADVYSRGESEEIVGKALKGRRDDVVLATKVHYPMGDDPNHRGNSRRWILTTVENSLRRLQSDHLDLYQVHRPDPSVDVDETLSALSDLIHSGKVRAIGTSSFPASEIIEAQWAAERRGLERFRTEQPPYSIINRGIDREVLPICQRYGIGTLVWSPLGQGLLTGRHPQGSAKRHPPVPRHAPAFRRRAQTRRGRTAHSTRRRGRSVDDAPRDGLLDRPPGRHFSDPRATHHRNQLDDLLAGADTTLDDEVLDRIDDIAPPGTDAAPQRRGLRTAGHLERQRASPPRLPSTPPPERQHGRRRGSP